MSTRVGTRPAALTCTFLNAARCKFAAQEAEKMYPTVRITHSEDKLFIHNPGIDDRRIRSFLTNLGGQF